MVTVPQDRPPCAVREDEQQGRTCLFWKKTICDLLLLMMEADRQLTPSKGRKEVRSVINTTFTFTIPRARVTQFTSPGDTTTALHGPSFNYFIMRCTMQRVLVLLSLVCMCVNARACKPVCV